MKIPTIHINQIPNIHFKEYYEVYIDQPLDHSTPVKGYFQQRFFLGINDPAASITIETDGYATDYATKPEYTNEIAEELKTNLLTVEHRFFGKSIPNSMDWKYLTVEQAAQDCHRIKTVLSQIFSGKWISTGVSKGGQAALGYKVYFPDDISATIVYGTGVKKQQNERNINAFLSLRSRTICGMKVTSFQGDAFERKKGLLPIFRTFVETKKYDFGLLTAEEVFDYLLLELPFSFWQNGNDCEMIPDSTASLDQMVDYVCRVVPPKYFSTESKKRLEPSFYMFYHELGYYEYNITALKEWLQNTEYSNKYFAPPGIDIVFDGNYLEKLNGFLKTEAAYRVTFIYGEFDPWSSMQETGNAKKIIVKSGSHKSRISNMSPEQKEEMFSGLKAQLK